MLSCFLLEKWAVELWFTHYCNSYNSSSKSSGSKYVKNTTLCAIETLELHSCMSKVTKAIRVKPLRVWTANKGFNYLSACNRKRHNLIWGFKNQNGEKLSLFPWLLKCWCCPTNIIIFNSFFFFLKIMVEILLNILLCLQCVWVSAFGQ